MICKIKASTIIDAILQIKSIVKENEESCCITIQFTNCCIKTRLSSDVLYWVKLCGRPHNYYTKNPNIDIWRHLYLALELATNNCIKTNEI